MVRNASPVRAPLTAEGTTLATATIAPDGATLATMEVAACSRPRAPRVLSEKQRERAAPGPADRETASAEISVSPVWPSVYLRRIYTDLRNGSTSSAMGRFRRPAVGMLQIRRNARDSHYWVIPASIRVRRRWRARSPARSDERAAGAVRRADRYRRTRRPATGAQNAWRRRRAAA